MKVKRVPKRSRNFPKSPGLKILFKPSQQTIVIGDRTVDLSREVLIDASGSIVPLRPRAWLVLRFLALHAGRDRKSTRLNSSHVAISYAVFCLKKKKKLNVKRRR